MANLMQPFNPMDFDPTQVAGQLPIGKHKVVIASSDIKATKKNDGGYLELTLKVIEGPQTGAEGVYRINIYAASDQAREIGNKQLSALCHVMGFFQPFSATEQLHNMPFMIEVGPQKNEPSYTEVKKVMDVNGNEPGKQNQQAAPTPAPASFQQPQQPQQQQQAPAWGNSAPAGSNNAPAPAWGGNQAQQQQPQQQQGGGWQQASVNGVAAPWGQR